MVRTSRINLSGWKLSRPVSKSVPLKNTELSILTNLSLLPCVRIENERWRRGAPADAERSNAAVTDKKVVMDIRREEVKGS